jgi:hypothetical protein
MKRFAAVALMLTSSILACSSGPDTKPRETATVIARLDTGACPVGTNIIAGTDGDDVLVGTAGRDCIVGGDGNDQLFGGNGDDLLIGGAGDDALFGQTGADRLEGGPGDDQLDGANGDDTLLGDDGNDVLLGGAGADTINGGSGHDVIIGANGTDTLSGDDGDDVIDPGNGGDTVSGGAGSDSCTGSGCELPPGTTTLCSSDANCPAGARCSSVGVCVRCLSDRECDDGNPCTADSCQPALGCRAPNQPDGTACPNPTVCDGLETCQAGSCTPGTPLVCDDGRFCTGSESCDAMAGCVGGVPPLLDDGIGCTVDTCNEDADRVEHTPLDSACDDGVFCNGQERCDANAGCQSGPPVTCASGYECAGSGCVNIDECARGTDTCSDNATCHDFAGSYSCTCNPLYEGDGRTCEPRCSPMTVATGAGRCVRARPDSTVDLRLSLASSIWSGPYTELDEPEENLCGPTAIKNFLSWYGTDADYGPLTAEMRTNTWDTGAVLAAVILAGPLVGCVEPICWAIVTSIVSGSVVKAGTLPSDVLQAMNARAPEGYVACIKDGDSNLENLRGSLATGNPVVFLESGGADNLHWAVATGIRSSGGNLRIRVDNTTETTWSNFQTRWSLTPVGDGAKQGLLSNLFGLKPYTMLRWIPAGEASGTRCP